MTKPRDLFDNFGTAIPGAERGQMFGKPCFKIGNKAFVCFFQDCMVFKLASDAHCRACSLKGARLFDPSGKGRAMKEWVQLPASHAVHWSEFTQSALDYVRAAG